MKDEDKTIYIEKINNPFKKIDRVNFRFLFLLIFLSPRFIGIGAVILVKIFTSKRIGIVFGYEPDFFYDKIAIFPAMITFYCK